MSKPANIVNHDPPMTQTGSYLAFQGVDSCPVVSKAHPVLQSASLVFRAQSVSGNPPGAADLQIPESNQELWFLDNHRPLLLRLDPTTI
jgi:hypothetical protein